MKHGHRGLAVVAIASLCAIAAAPTQVDAGKVPATESGQRYIVRFRSKTGLDETIAAEASSGTRVGKVWRNALNGFVANLSPDDLLRLQHDPDVVAVERDSIVEALGDQVDPPWGLDRVDQTALPLTHRYSYGSTGSGVTAYIVDSGIRTTHTEFSGRVLPGWSAYSSDGTGVEDCNGHGTHVSGIVGGTISGVAKGVSLVPVKVLSCAGSSLVSTVIAGLDWVIADHPAGAPAVANLSIGGDASSALDAAVKAVIADGVTVVIAAGNAGLNTCNYSPARVPAAITVGASQKDDSIAAYSNYGPCNDLFAPGTSIQSAGLTDDTASATMSGTSMATPHVTGAVARILQAAPWDSPADVWAQLSADATSGALLKTFGGDPNTLLHVPKGSPAPPCAPQLLSGVRSDSQVALSWSAPYDDGSPITDYVIQYRPSGGSWTVFADAVSTATTAVVTGLVNGTGYDFTVAAVNALGTGAASNPLLSVIPSDVTTGFAALDPVRLFDTRPSEPQGAITIAKQQYGTLRVKVTNTAGIPATGVGAVSLNVTVVNPVGTGFVTVYPCGELPPTSSLNYTTGQTIPNAVITPVSPDGEICLYSSTGADLLADVNGWFASSAGFAALDPVRLFDTRPSEPQGAITIAKQQYGTLRVKVTNTAGIPATGVGAVSLNVTVVNPVGTGFVTVYPCGELPPTSSLNYTTGQTIPNAVITPVSPDGEICLYSSTGADLLADVNGWFASSAGFAALDPVRLFDTRPSEPQGAITIAKQQYGTLRVKVTNTAGIPATGVGAVSLNVTVVNPVGTGFVTVYPCGELPPTSSLNYTTGQTIPNAVITPVSPDGEICLYSSTGADLLADVNGWFASA